EGTDDESGAGESSEGTDEESEGDGADEEDALDAELLDEAEDRGSDEVSYDDGSDEEAGSDREGLGDTEECECGARGESADDREDDEPEDIVEDCCTDDDTGLGGVDLLQVGQHARRDPDRGRGQGSTDEDGDHRVGDVTGVCADRRLEDD